jgi:hypothetical protein
MYARTQNPTSPDTRQGQTSYSEKLFKWSIIRFALLLFQLGNRRSERDFFDLKVRLLSYKASRQTGVAGKGKKL